MLFSRVFLQDRSHIIEEWKHRRLDDVLYYVLRQIQQFQQSGEAFTLHHQGSRIMTQTLQVVKAAVIAKKPREEFLGWLSPEDRLKGMPPEERLKGLLADEALQGLSDQERQRLIELAKRLPEKP